MDQLIAALKGESNAEVLSKSDTVPRGFQGPLNPVEFNLSGVVDKVVGRYLKAMKYLLVGGYTDEKMTEEDWEYVYRIMSAAGIDKDQFIPGIIPSAYLSAIDAQRDYYFRLYGSVPPAIDQKVMKVGLEAMVDQQMKYVNLTTETLKTNIETTFKKLQDFVNIDNQLLSVQNEAENGSRILKPKDMVTKPPITIMSEEFINTFKQNEIKINQNVHGSMATAAAAGSHQSVIELYGTDRKTPKVVYMTMEDDRVTDWCHNMSHDNRGGYKVYKITDLKPAGWNLGKPKKDWSACVPPSHFRCRSWLVYVPDGFTVIKGGILISEARLARQTKA